MKELKRAFGVTVKELRKSRNMSQGRLAKDSGLHVNTIHLLENGKTDPRFTTILFIANAIGIKLEEFIKLVNERM